MALNSLHGACNYYGRNLLIDIGIPDSWIKELTKIVPINPPVSDIVPSLRAARIPCLNIANGYLLLTVKCRNSKFVAK